MNFIKIYLRLICIIFLLASTFYQLDAQVFLPEQIMYKMADDHIKFRWEPASIEEWHASFELGYQLRIYSPENRLSPVSVKTIKPYPFDAFNEKYAQAPESLTPYYDASRSLLHPSEAANPDLEKFLNSIVSEHEHAKDSFRLSFLSFYSSLDMQLAELNGLGVRMSVPPKDYVAVLQVRGFAEREIEIRVAENKKDNDFPALRATWSNRTVKLSWDNFNSYRKYFGFYLECAVNGKSYTRTTELPLLDPSVGVDGNKSGESMGIRDSLDKNYIPITYRLRRVNYFGEISDNYSETTGEGFIGLTSSPILTMAEQMENNYAHLEWKINDADLPLIKNFSIYRSDRDRGTYIEVKSDIPKNQREVFIPMEYKVNYYRIEVNPFEGHSLSTMPMLIMGIDTTPPALPQLVHALIDTNGAIQILWNANEEDDLWGYSIYKANFADAEYSLLNATPTMDTMYTDTVSLTTGAANVFYVLEAADRRNNRSEFTEPIKLEKPDVVPPFTPVVHHLVQHNDTLEVYWLPSSSEDAVQHQLFRRTLDSDEMWTLIAQMELTDTNYVFLDSPLDFGKSYAYTIRAIDDVGLLSEFAKLKAYKYDEPEAEFLPFKNIKTTINKKLGEVTITWDMADPERFESLLVYRGTDENRVTKYKYIDAPQMSITEKISENETVYFKLRPTYTDQRAHYVSDMIAVSYDDFEGSTPPVREQRKKKGKRRIK